MESARIDVTIANPAQPERQQEVQVLVDSSTMLGVIPRTLLEKLGIESIGTRNFRRPAGVVTSEVAGVEVIFEGTAIGTTVGMGDEDEPLCLGLTAWGALGYRVDPSTGKLEKTDMLMLPVA